MEAERRALIDSTITHCIRCKVPYGTYGCTHPPHALSVTGREAREVK
jgi:hypothetical protein